MSLLETLRQLIGLARTTPVRTRIDDMPAPTNPRETLHLQANVAQVLCWGVPLACALGDDAAAVKSPPSQRDDD